MLKYNPMLGKHHSEETKAKIRQKHLGENNGMFGRHHTPEAKAKMREKLLGSKSPRWKGDQAKKHAGHMRAEKLFQCPIGMERHHIDGNPLNNSPENIMFVTPKQHVMIDGRNERHRKYEGKRILYGGRLLTEEQIELSRARVRQNYRKHGRVRR